MFLLDTAEKIMVMVFLVTTMLSIGLQTRLSDFRALAASRGFLLRVLGANFLIVPAVGALLALLIPLKPHVAGALVLLASTPGGLSSLQFTSQVKGGASLAGAIFCLLSLLALFISPLILRLLMPGSVQLVVPYGRSLLFFLVFLFLPLVVGMFTLYKLPQSASWLSRLIALIAIVVFIAFMVKTGSGRQAAVGEIGWVAMGTMLLFIFISMAVGWFMGGPSHDSRQIVAVSTSMRNVALCLAIVAVSAPGHAVIVPLVAFSLLMVPTNMLFSLYHNLRHKRKAGRGP